MNSEELKQYRKHFYENLQQYMKNKKLDDIIDISINQTEIHKENTNKIMVCMGTYMQEKDSLKTVEYLTYNTNYKAKYRLYMDIESQMIFKVLYNNIIDFEKEYKVIYMPITVYNVQEYNKKYNELRREFFRNLLYSEQEDVVQKLVKKINN